MGGIYRFFKSTILGGLVVLVPLIAFVAIAGWAGNIAVKAVMPVLTWLPDKSVGGVSVALATAMLGLVGLSFLAGLFAESTLMRTLGDRAERIALVVPGYALMKSFGTDLVGIEGKSAVRTVEVHFGASSQLGFLMDTLADGRHVVFVPGVPRALVGSMHIVAPAHLRFLELSVPAALDALSRLGVGLRESWPTETKLAPSA